MFIRTFLLAFLLLPLVSRGQPVPIGHWREHLPWREATGLAVAGDRLYCSTPYGVFAISLPGGEITRYSKVNGLHEGNVAAIGGHGSSGAVVIAYDNGNLDVLRNEHIVNIPELKLSGVTGSKRTHEITFAGDLAFLCTGAGIVALHLERLEIADSWRIGATTSLAHDGRYFYAATVTGVRRASAQGANLADPGNWEAMAACGSPSQVGLFNNQLMALEHDTLFVLSAGRRDRWFANGASITGFSISGETLFVHQPGRVLQLSANGNLLSTFPCQAPAAALSAAQATWVADGYSGLLRFNGSTPTNYTPNAPRDLVTGDLLVHNNALWAAAGGVTPAWQGLRNTAGLSVFEQEEWRHIPNPDSIRDLLCLIAAGNDIYAGSFGAGLLTVNGQAREKPGGDSLVSGLAADRAGQLWVTTYGAQQSLHARRADNSWAHFSIPFFHTGRAVSQVLVDDADQKWIVSPRGNGVFVFNHGAGIDNTADDRWKFYQPGAGQGNLPSADVRCLARDRNGYIWIGTARGVAIVQCPATFCDAYWPILKEDNFAGYLFQHEQVNAIAVDGANRKWVGTQNGVWLVAPGGDKILEHFNTANSPLPSNIIHRIAVHPATGEVFFATAAGLLSWRGTATEGTPIQGNEVLVFPNPVPPAYEGTIAIRGLVQNAIVKITDAAGRLVHQTRANGGQAVWNGRDYTGRRPQSGVYLVFATDDSGQEKIVTKLVFIH